MNRTSDILHKLAYASLCLGMTIGLAGCRHRVVVAPLPSAKVPVAPISEPSTGKPPMLETPHTSLPETPIAAAASKPKRERKRTAKVAGTSIAPEPAATTPAAAPVAAPAESSTLGALTAGGEADPQTKQDATDLIASIEKRLNALPAQLSEDEKAQINKVRNFWRDAQAALKSGDAEGAMTLATKAKLLLDDQQQ